MEISNTMAEMYAMRTKLRTKRESARAALEVAQAELDVAEANLATWEKAIVLYEADPPALSDDTPLEITALDIKHCETQPEALRTYAKLNDGLVNVTKAGDLIIQAGLSKGKRASVHSTLHNFMTRRNDEWEWVEPGLFRLKSVNGVYSKQIVDEDDFQPLPLIHDGMTP